MLYKGVNVVNFGLENDMKSLVRRFANWLLRKTDTPDPGKALILPRPTSVDVQLTPPPLQVALREMPALKVNDQVSVIPLEVPGGYKTLVHFFDAKKLWLYDAIFIQGQYLSGLSIKVTYVGLDEPILDTKLNPRYGERFMLLGVHDHRAEAPVKLVIECSKPFIIDSIRATYKRPAFRREDGMIIFQDPFYPPVSEEAFLSGPSNPHHRKLYGPGIDIGYR